MSMHAMPECKQSQTNGFRGGGRPWQLAVLMLCVLLLVSAFVQPASAGPPGCPTYQLFGAADPGGGSLLSAIDPSTGLVTFIGPITGFFRITGIDFHPYTSVLYAVGTTFTIEGPVYGRLLTIDPCTGVGTEVALLDYGGPIAFSPGNTITDMSFNPISGALYVYWKIAGFKDIVATVNLATGALSNISPVLPIPDTSSTSGNGLAWSGLSLVCCPAPLPTLYHGFGEGLSTVNTFTGVRTFQGTFTWPPAFALCTGFPGCRPNSMDYQPVTNTLFASVYDGGGGNFLATINTTTRVVTSVGPVAPHQDSLAFYPNQDADGDGVLDSVDNCPSTYNPDQADRDFDGKGDVCDNCPSTTNASQGDADGDGVGDACDTPAGTNFGETLSGVSPTWTPGAPNWVTATFTYNGTGPIYTPAPNCFNTEFTLKQGTTLVRPRILEGPPVDYPNDFIVINSGATFSVVCDLSERYIASRVPSGSYTLTANYQNDVDPATVEPGFAPPPGTTLFLGTVNSQSVTITASGTPVTQTSASVVYAPSTWSTQWTTSGSPSPIVGTLTLIPGTACTGMDLTQPIRMNGSVSGSVIAGSTGTNANVAFSGGAAVQSLGMTNLGTTSPGTYYPTVQGSCSSPANAIFTAKAAVNVGLTVSIDIKPGSGTNPINMGSRGVVPTAIFSTATFDATKVLPGSITLAGGTVNLKGKGKSTYQFSISDLNGDGRPDMLVHIDTTTMTLSPSMASAVLEGIYVQDLGNGNTRDVPIYGEDAVTIVP